MNWIKKLLGLKTDKQCAISGFSGSLSVEQLERADMWYCLHKNHVNKLYRLADNPFPPTQHEDKNNPALWKAGHWKWYLDNYRYTL
jgi:hypothetical protein